MSQSASSKLPLKLLCNFTTFVTPGALSFPQNSAVGGGLRWSADGRTVLVPPAVGRSQHWNLLCTLGIAWSSLGTARRTVCSTTA